MVKMKKLVENKFTLVDLKEIIGKSISDYCATTKETVVVAMFAKDNDKVPAVIFSNSEKYVDEYNEKGVKSFLAADVRAFLIDEVKVGQIAEVFPGSEFIHFKAVPAQETLF